MPCYPLVIGDPLSFQYAQLFLAGLAISLTGSLPLGVLNIAAMQIAAKETVAKALRFAIGVTIVEMAYLIVTLAFITRLANQTQLFLVFTILSIILLLVMAAGSIMTIFSKEKKNILLENSMNRLLLGGYMSLLNPLQIPFWIGWSLYLLSIRIQLNTLTQQSIFTLSAGIGTFLAMLLFIFVGKRFKLIMERNKTMINVVMALLFTTLAVFQIIKIL